MQEIVAQNSYSTGEMNSYVYPALVKKEKERILTMKSDFSPGTRQMFYIKWHAISQLSPA